MVSKSSKYRSKFEERVFSKGTLKGIKYEPKPYAYKYVEHHDRKYTPDGEFTDLLYTRVVWVELKGRFRTKAEAEKYLRITEYHPDKDFFFVFLRKGTYMPRCRSMTQEKWCKKVGLKFTFEDELQEYLDKHYPRRK